MNYKSIIAFRAFIKTATFREVLAAYEGDERRQRELERRKNPEGVADGGDRRQGIRRNMPRDTIEFINDQDVVLHIRPKGFVLYNKALNPLAEFSDEMTTFDVWEKIVELEASGDIKPNYKVYSTTKADPAIANLLDITPVFKNSLPR